MVLKPAGQGPAKQDDTFNRMGDNAKLMDTRLRSYWPIRDEYDATNLSFICRKWLSPQLPQANATDISHQTWKRFAISDTRPNATSTWINWKKCPLLLLVASVAIFMTSPSLLNLHFNILHRPDETSEEEGAFLFTPRFLLAYPFSFLQRKGLQELPLNFKPFFFYIYLPLTPPPPPSAIHIQWKRVKQ